MSNVPDDYHIYWSRCGYCGARVHPAEHPDCDCEVCEECDRIVPECTCTMCERCGASVPPGDLLCGFCAEMEEMEEMND
jgi:hypothetical protein